MRPWRIVGIGMVGLATLVGLAADRADGQDRLKAMPGYARFREKSPVISGSVRSGALDVVWRDGGQAFEYRKDGKTWHYDIATRTASEAKPGTPAPPARTGRPGRAGGGGVGRGQQTNAALSPDGTLRAFYRDRNLWVKRPQRPD